MNKITIIIILLIFSTQLFAQIKITGKVTDGESGEALPGATIFLKNTDVGTTTDIAGLFSIEVVSETDILVFSFIGYETKEVTVGSQREINLVLKTGGVDLEEVVVTALGVSREKRSLGYSIEEISADDIAVKDPTSISNSLQGRVSGIQIRSGSGTVGGSSSVLIRGVSSLGGGNQPLYIVDGTPIANYNFSNTTEGYDFGNGAQDINPDDVESISVLKGAAATALYGSRAANGVIIITTKSGKKKQGLGIEINSTTTFDNIYIFPNFQNEYGGGSSLEFPLFEYDPAVHGSEWESFDGTPLVETRMDESWGPRLDGTEVLHWDSFVPESDSYNQTRPFSANSDNYKKLFDTGLTLSNSVALNGGNEKSAFRLGFTNITQKGIVPNSKLKKNIVSFKASNELHEKFEIFISGNYIKQETTGRSRFGYSSTGMSVPGSMRIWTQRQIDSDRLRNLYYSEQMGQQVGWNFKNASNGDFDLGEHNNAFWTLNNIYATDAKDRVYGNVGFIFKIIDGLTLTSTVRTDFYTMFIDKRIGSGGMQTDYFYETMRNSYENNFESMLNYNKRFKENWSLNAILGGNILYNKYKRRDTYTADGLIIENYFNVYNSNIVEGSNVFTERQTNSLFTSVSVGFKSYLYLDVSARNDWSSTLPVENNSYFYPAVSGSFIFSELFKNNSILSFGKIRAGYAQVGNDTYAYRLYNNYELTTFGETSTYTVPNESNYAFLRPETTKEYEFGIETSFFNGKAGLNLTYFDRTSFDQILGLDVSSTSGFSTAVINSGELQNTGLETSLFVSPVKTKDFFWNVNLNFSKYNSTLLTFNDVLDEFEISSVGSAWVIAEVGEEYGTLYTDGGYEYNENGDKLVDANGRFVKSGEPEKMGSILPDFNGGVMNIISYKGISFSALLDFQKGGLIYSYANRWSTKSGQTTVTVGLNDIGNPVRLPVEDGGGIRSEGVFEEGTIIDGIDVSGQPNNIYLEARTYFSHLKNFPEEFVYDASFIKLREIKIAYSLPKSFVSKTGFNAISFSVIARNVALLYANADGFDPDQVVSISNEQGYESGALPSSRSIGFNINLKF